MSGLKPPLLVVLQLLPNAITRTESVCRVVEAPKAKNMNAR